MSEPITAMIVDDHEMVRKGAKGYLEAQPDITVVAEAKSDTAAVQLAREHVPDVVLMDLVIPTDLSAALAQNEAAERHFYACSDSPKKNIPWWIKSAKHPATRHKRIAETVRLAQHDVRANHPEARAFDRQNNLRGESKDIEKINPY